jgi:hypothetical protein
MTYTALKFVNEEVVPRLRNGSYRILITLTDGRANENREDKTIADAEFNFQLRVGVGVGDRVLDDELEDFSSNDESYHVGNFQELQDIIDQIISHTLFGVEQTALLQAAGAAEEDSATDEVEVIPRTSAPTIVETTLGDDLIPVTPEDDEPEPGYDYEDFSGDADDLEQ